MRTERQEEVQQEGFKAIQRKNTAELRTDRENVDGNELFCHN